MFMWKMCPYLWLRAAVIVIVTDRLDLLDRQNEKAGLMKLQGATTERAMSIHTPKQILDKPLLFIICTIFEQEAGKP